jgi:hypothetical protein
LSRKKIAHRGRSQAIGGVLNYPSTAKTSVIWYNGRVKKRGRL